MPRYFFELKGSGATDLEGSELPNDAAARAEAVQVAKELALNNPAASGYVVVVRTERGEIVHEVPLVWN